MTKLHSHYESLNVTRDAPPEVIRAAYRSLSQKHHPDKNIGNQDAARMMARLNTAYSVLSDSEQRELYDLQLLSEQRDREQHFPFQTSVDEGSATVAYAPFNVGGSGRTGHPASGTPGRNPWHRARTVLLPILKYATGRNARNAAIVTGVLSAILIPLFWLSWKDQQSMLLLERAAIHASDTDAAPAPARPAAPDGQADVQATVHASRTKPTGVGVIQMSGPSGLDPASAELSKPAAAPKAPPEPSAAVKPSEYERLTAMLKKMGLGLHKLDLSTLASSPKPPAVPAKAAEPARAAEADRANSAPPPVQAARPAASPDTGRTREDAERPAPDAQRNDTKIALAEASRASAAPAVNANPASASHAPRTAVLADARGCASPAYPPNAYRNGESGSVLLALLVGGDGRVIESKVQKSSGSPELDKAARKALSQCKFKPASGDGQAEPIWTTLNFVWTLD